MISYVLFVFSFLASITGGVEGATSVYKPTEVFLFNCGNTSDNVDLNGRNWMAENRKILPLNSDNASISSDTLYQDSRVHQVPYMKARIFRYDFTYSFSVFLGWKFLRLYFFPTQYKSGFDAVNSFFSVTVNGFTLLRNFSADLTMGNKKVLTGGSSKAYGSGSYRDPLLQQNQDKSKANGSENGPDDLEHGVVEVFVYRCNWIDMHGFAGVAI